MSGRFTSLLGGCALAAVVGALMVGAAGEAIPMVPLLLLATGGLVLLVQRGRAVPVAENPWSSPTPLPTAAAPAPRPAASEWAIARALGRVEARQLLISGAFGIGLGFLVLLLVLFGFVWGSQNTDPWFDLAPLAPWYCFPLVGMTVVGAHRAVTRARRDGVDELLGTCPVPEATRTLGFLLSAVTPTIALATFLTVGAVTLYFRSPYVYGSLGARDWADVVSALVLGIGGVALGVALGRWLRFALVPIVAVVLVGVLGGRLAEVGGHDWNPYSILAMAPTVEWGSPVFQARPAGWHLAWVVGLTALVAVIAVARHRRDRLVQGLAVTVALIVVISGMASTRPMSAASADRIARAIAHPGEVQECTTTGSVSVCLYPIHRPILRRVLEDIAPVVAVLPEAAGELTLRQRYDGELADLPPEVRRRLVEGDLRSPAGEVAIEFGEDVEYALGRVSYQLALGSVGLPDRHDPQGMPLVVAGQARGVVALWLATRGRDAGEVEDLTRSPLPASPDPFDRGSLEEGDCSEPALVWSEQDLTAVRSVVALPQAEVLRVLDGSWARWTDPTTGTDELLAALGLAPVGPFDHVEARPGNPC